MFNTLCAGLFGGTVFSHGTSANQVVVLAKDGKAECSIVLPADALKLEKMAARELADHLEKSIGDRPRLGDKPGHGSTIYVGRSPTIDQLVADVDFDALGTDGIVVRTVGGDLVLTGGRPRGVLFAVYGFLQDVVGFRWWAPDVTHVPTRPTLAVSDLNVVYRPPFDQRVFHTGAFQGDLAFALRLRHNGFILGLSPNDHTIMKLLPPEEYFLEHPDWYVYTPEDDENTNEYNFPRGLARMTKSRPASWVNLAVKTRRLPHDVCLSSIGALEAVTVALRRQLKEDYPKWQYAPKIVLVTQNNGGWQCKCDPCQVTTQREGSASGGWIAFVNSVAERLEKDYPDVLVGTMAFLQNEKPPTHLRPHRNVLVNSIPVTSDRKLPISEVPAGQWVTQWCDIAQQVYIWEHAVNYWRPIPPHPNHFVMAPNLRFFAEQGVKGMMIEGKSGNVSELQQMRAYVACRLMWDPSEDERELMMEFLDGYYGDAAPFLMKWINLQHEAVLRAEKFALSAYTLSTEGWLTFEDMNQGTRLFEQALQAVIGDATLEHRVRHARLSVDVVWLERYDELLAAAEQRGRPFLGPDDPLAELDRIAEDEFKLAWTQFPKYVEKLRESLTTQDD